MTTVYVCGPMSGYEDHNEPEFRAAAALFVDLPWCHGVIVPHDLPPVPHAGPCPAGPPAQVTDAQHGVACFLRADLAALLTCDLVYVLRGWEASVGARLEVQVAAACGITLEFQV